MSGAIIRSGVRPTMDMVPMPAKAPASPARGGPGGGFYRVGVRVGKSLERFGPLVGVRGQRHDGHPRGRDARTLELFDDSGGLGVGFSETKRGGQHKDRRMVSDSPRTGEPDGIKAAAVIAPARTALPGSTPGGGVLLAVVFVLVNLAGRCSRSRSPSTAARRGKASSTTTWPSSTRRGNGAWLPKRRWSTGSARPFSPRCCTAACSPATCSCVSRSSTARPTP